MDWKGYQEEEELKQAEKKYGKNMYDLLFVNEWTCLLALFGQIFKNTNISWIQFSFYQYIKCLILWSTNVKYKKKIQFFLSKHYWYSCENTVFFAKFYAVKIFEF